MKRLIYISILLIIFTIEIDLKNSYCDNVLKLVTPLAHISKKDSLYDISIKTSDGGDNVRDIIKKLKKQTKRYISVEKEIADCTIEVNLNRKYTISEVLTEIGQKITKLPENKKIMIYQYIYMNYIFSKCRYSLGLYTPKFVNIKTKKGGERVKNIIKKLEFQTNDKTNLDKRLYNYIIGLDIKGDYGTGYVLNEINHALFKNHNIKHLYIAIQECKESDSGFEYVMRFMERI